MDKNEDREVSAGFGDLKQFGESKEQARWGGLRSEGVRLPLAEGTARARVLRWRTAVPCASWGSQAAGAQLREGEAASRFCAAF